MPEIQIGNLTVDFPFEPYDIQKDYMDHVVTCLQQAKNGVLESPTGTGKTLSLLCSSLAWLRTQKAAFQLSSYNVGSDGFLSDLQNQLNNQSGSGAWNGVQLRPPKIIYASRTHSQLNQVMLELKKTAYRDVKVSIIGSRDQLCIHPEVSKETNLCSKVQMCKSLVSSRACPFYNNVENSVKDPIFQVDRLVDIEDLVAKGRRTRCCPYFASRELQNDADILFTPYNYLLDPKTRKAQDIRLQSDVIILDEAHNVEKVCEESTSSQISSTTIAVCMNEISAVMKKLLDETQSSNYGMTEPCLPKDFNADDLILLKTLFMLLEKIIDGLKLSESTAGNTKKSLTFAGGYIFDLLEKANVTASSIKVLLDVLNAVCQYLMTVNESQVHQRGTGLFKFMEFLEVVFHSLGPKNSVDSTNSNYKLYIEQEVPKQAKGGSWMSNTVSDTSGKVLNFWCFNPGFGMRSLLEQGIRCVILTSGTLSPLQATISEIGIPVGVQLSNSHIIKRNQICALVVEKGPANNELRCVYQNRSNRSYLMDLGQTCLNLYRIIPGGVLVFFPSYPFLKSCVECWQESGLWDKLAAIKSIFVEPQSKDALKSLMDEYYKTIDERSSASLFAVCRGKVSEGMDFADSRARAVLVIGLPYPPFNDPKVTLKRAYLDESKRRQLSTLDGNEWYQLEAMRAINQAIGRVIRHAGDHGAMIFCDCRFSYSNNVKSLSKWIQEYVVTGASFGQVIKQVCDFFRQWKDVNDVARLFNSGSDPLNISHQNGIVRPAQKLAITSNYANSSSIDFTKMYNVPSTSTEIKQEPKTNYDKTKSLLDNLENDDVLDSSNISLILKSEPSTSHKNIVHSKPEADLAVSRKRIKLSSVPIRYEAESTSEKFDTTRFTLKLQKSLDTEQQSTFKEAVRSYSRSSNYEEFISVLSKLFLRPGNKELLLLYRDVPFFLKTEEHKAQFWKSYFVHIKK